MRNSLHKMYSPRDVCVEENDFLTTDGLFWKGLFYFKYVVFAVERKNFFSMPPLCYPLKQLCNLF